MSYKGTHKIDGFFEYVVPPLEGFWWQDGMNGTIDYNNKGTMNFISIIRLPDFVTKADFEWAIEEAIERSEFIIMGSVTLIWLLIYTFLLSKTSK